MLLFALKSLAVTSALLCVITDMQQTALVALYPTCQNCCAPGVRNSIIPSLSVDRVLETQRQAVLTWGVGRLWVVGPISLCSS